MAEKSMFQPGGDGMTRGGLDRYLGPPAGDISSMPPRIEDAEADPEDKIELDCDGKDASEPLCEIAKLEEEQRETGANAT